MEEQVHRFHGYWLHYQRMESIRFQSASASSLSSAASISSVQVIGHCHSKGPAKRDLRTSRNGNGREDDEKRFQLKDSAPHNILPSSHKRWAWSYLPSAELTFIVTISLRVDCGLSILLFLWGLKWFPRVLRSLISVSLFGNRLVR